MRTLCLILILSNALFLAWSQLIDVHVNDLDRNTAANTPPPARIVLAREVTTTPEPEIVNAIQPPHVAPLAAAPPQVATASAADNLSCTTVGPFADLADAAQAQSALRNAGFTPRQRLEQGELWVGYWVSVQSFESREAAEAALQSLNDAGFTDVYLMPGSDPANVLSLGVFSDYQRAQRRAEEIRTLGLEPRIDDRKRAGSVYWIDADLSEPGQMIDTSIFQPGPGKIMRLELRACPPVQGNG